MPKNFFQDMVKIKHANDTKYNKESVLKKPIKKQEPKYKPEESLPDLKTKSIPIYETSPIQNNGKKSSHALWLVAGVAVMFLFFTLSFVFSGAKVMINPRVKDLGLKNSFSAVKDSISEGLSFDLIAISGEESLKIKGGGEQDVSLSARGVVVVFNTFSTSSQLLAIDTRLLGSNGKIYKTKTKIVVPGMTKDSKPGSMEVEVYGSEPGEDYNSGPLDFTVAGFKGTSKYDKFYARSKGEITGGLLGKHSIVSDLEKNTTLDTLKTTLKEKLLKNAADTIPSGFILFKDAIFLNIDDENIGVASVDGMIPFSLKGTLYGFLFEEKKLTQKITESAVEKYDGNEVYIPNIRDFVFNLSEQDATLFKDVTKITFNLSGSSQIIWKLDEEKLVTDMLGKKKNDFNQVLSLYPNVVSAEVTFHPFWKRSFPEKASSIKLIVNYPE
ncbi:MAG: hypothetical protein Q8O46_04645 [bacterium]|nr:hypothetical protein [bacterium]